MYILHAVVYSQDLYHPVLIGHQTLLLLYVTHHVCDLQADEKRKQCQYKITQQWPFLTHTISCSFWEATKYKVEGATSRMTTTFSRSVYYRK